MDNIYTESLRRIILRGYQIRSNTVINLSLMLEENENNGAVYMSVRYNDQIFESDGGDLYSAFQRLKDQLLDESVGLQCYGSMLNVHSSSTMRDTSKAYLLELNKKAAYENAVDILKYIDIIEFATSNQQNEFYQKWLDSVR